MTRSPRTDSRSSRSSPARTPTLKPLYLVETARLLARNGRKPRQSDLKRAVSTAYYALFHALCRNCADCFIGGKRAARSEKAWLQAYRAAEHRYAASRCKDRTVMARFPKEIEDFANMFFLMQNKRIAADYDPSSRFARTEVHADIEAVDAAIEAFSRAGIRDRRAFAAWVTIRDR